MSEQEQDRNIYRDGEDYIIETSITQTFDEEEFDSVIQNIENQIDERENKLQQIQQHQEDILENHPEEMEIIHALVEGEDQEVDEIRNNSVGVASINKFVSLRDTNDQKQDLHKEIENLKNDLEELMEAKKSEA